MRLALRLVLVAIAAILTGCATTNLRRVSALHQSRLLTGTDHGVRIDVEVGTDELALVSSIALSYSITNQRTTTIAVAELLPDASYDPDSGIVTVGIGSEVPGQELLPRLIAIAAGEQKDFREIVRIDLSSAASGVNRSPLPSGLQVKLDFLSDSGAFTSLIGIPERAVYDPKLAAELFPEWLEANEVVLTNVVPMRWSASRRQPEGRSTGSPHGEKAPWPRGMEMEVLSTNAAGLCPPETNRSSEDRREGLSSFPGQKLWRASVSFS